MWNGSTFIPCSEHEEKECSPWSLWSLYVVGNEDGEYKFYSVFKATGSGTTSMSNKPRPDMFTRVTHDDSRVFYSNPLATCNEFNILGTAALATL